MARLRGAARLAAGDSSAKRPPGPLITARLIDGPMASMTVDVAAVEGRPPKTVDLDGPEGTRSRYCLAEWQQSGGSADYAFLYEV